jgi:hypothetical protein
LLLLKCVDVNIHKNVFKFVHYAYMYRMYDVFSFCVHVVVDVDNFFPRALLFLGHVSWWSAISSLLRRALTNIVFVAFLLFYSILFLLY